MSGEVLVPRSSVVRFAIEMEQKLQANDKGEWHDNDIEDLVRRLHEETQELQFAIDAAEWCGPDHRLRQEPDHRVRQEAVDVANFARMIADRFR